MQIVFENSHFVVVNKPAGSLSVPSRMGAKDARPVVGLLLQQQLGLSILPVHRLDLEVSGLLLFAKTKAAHASANSWFEKKQVHKTYIALTTGFEPSSSNFEWKSKILRGKKRAYESPVGKDSVTQAKCLGPKSLGENISYLLWELNPVTGRSHQLRFDLSRHGFPILGDRLYGSSTSWPLDATEQSAIALQAKSILFPAAAKDFSLPQKIELPAAF